MRNEPKKSEGIIILKKDTIVTMLIISILALSIIFIGVLFVKNIQYGQTLIKNESLLKADSSSYADTNLNIIVNYPNDWGLAEIDLTDTASIAKESSSGLIFNMENHALTKEVVSCMLVANQTETGGFGQFMSLSFRGDDSKRGKDLQDYVAELLKQEIILTEADNVVIKKTEILNDTSVYVEAECTLKGVPIYYTQYTTLVGKNFGTALLGEKSKNTDSNIKVASLINNILIQNVPSSIPNGAIPNEVTPNEVTQNEVTPNGFQIGR